MLSVMACNFCKAVFWEENDPLIPQLNLGNFVKAVPVWHIKWQHAQASWFYPFTHCLWSTPDSPFANNEVSTQGCAQENHLWKQSCEKKVWETWNGPTVNRYLSVSLMMKATVMSLLTGLCKLAKNSFESKFLSLQSACVYWIHFWFPFTFPVI